VFRKVLVANRGEIAARIIRTLRRLGVASVAVYSDADRFTRPALDADEAVRIGPPPAQASYLDVEAVLAACRRTGAEAVHPGFGFLSENASFAERLLEEGIAFIGPRPEHLRRFGLKHLAREAAAASGVPLLPGSGVLVDLDDALRQAEAIGYPVMLKSTAGGGGIGMQLCADPPQLRERLPAVQRAAQASFGDPRVFAERYVAGARHVEVQIFGDGSGRVVALGERDCSLQRRNQKVLEETPAPGLREEVRARLHAAAVALGRHVDYLSAGTVEFIYDPAREDFYFLEVNTRLQVEHPVTEAVLGIDLVEWMVRQAAGEDVLAGAPALTPSGAAIEVRIYAENPQADFRPSAGLLTEVRLPAGVRVDGWVETGTEVTPFYDPMLAKVVVHAATRGEAVARLREALAGTSLAGIETNLDYLRAIATSDLLAEGRIATTTLNDFAAPVRTADVLAPGAQSSLQELPGRLGLWHVGVPPSGPMDERSFRRANRLVGNDERTLALECTVDGPTLRFNTLASVALAGAQMRLTVDGALVPHDRPFRVEAGQVLAVGAIDGPGQRSYLAVRGGFEAPVVLGSRATFALGAFGGHATGVLKGGDVLHLGASPHVESKAGEEAPELRHDWTIGIVYGPHGAPDFFQPADIDDLFEASYEVHFNSARTGVRLIGPAPRWARTDGGEAGLHPSNLHDNAYAIGALDFTGDMPIILGPDGPSLGGFVCPGVIARDEQWKIGQLRPGDSIRFAPAARPDDPVTGPSLRIRATEAGSPIVGRRDNGPVEVVYRRQGDNNLLVEYGPMTLDIGLRLRVHALAEAIRQQSLPWLIDLTPGIRSLQIHYDGGALPRARLLGLLQEIESGMPDQAGLSVPSRIVHLPLCWNDPDVVLAMRKYQDLVRPNAPWCPDNIEFIRRINGLADEDEVRRIVFDARYLVLGLGDVYLGAPVATPVDPRHRLVTTKYNPARTWTPENAVGIGGAYLCVYGMEGPGGYQLFGRTIQVWNTWRTTPVFLRDTPWLLRFFDQIRFFPVSHKELLEARAAFPHGAYPLRIEETRFSYAEETVVLAQDADAIASFRRKQQAAFEAERRRWVMEGLDTFQTEEVPAALTDYDLPPGCTGVSSGVPGNIWKYLVAPGDRVAAGDTIAVVESMKMDFAVTSLASGRLREIRVAPGRTIRSGDVIALVEEA
jgi:urea carboxylase